MPRRGENIRKRTDGRWEGRYVVYLPGKGKQQKSVYGKTYSEVKKKRGQALEAADCPEPNSVYPPNASGRKEILFGDIANEWLSKIEITKKPSTHIKYRHIYKTHLENLLSEYPLNDLSTDCFQDMLANKTANYSGSIQKSIYSVASGTLNYSAENYHTPLVLLKRKVSAPSGKKLNIYSRTEQTALLRYLYDDMDLKKMGIVLCLSTGLRLGEVCALKWEDIDLQSRILHVNHTVQRISISNRTSKTVLCEGKPKTPCSQREIPLSDEMIFLLSRFRHPDKYVLNNSAPLEPRTYQYQFKKYQDQAGVSCKNFHVLRHTFATNCIGNGVDIKSLSEILGHSNVQITLNKYVHPTLDTKRQHMNTISSVYSRILGQTLN